MDDSQIADFLESLAKKIRCGDAGDVVVVLTIHADGRYEEIIQGNPFTVIGLVNHLTNRAQLQLIKEAKEQNK